MPTMAQSFMFTAHWDYQCLSKLQEFSFKSSCDDPLAVIILLVAIISRCCCRRRHLRKLLEDRTLRNAQERARSLRLSPPQCEIDSFQ